MKEDYDTPEQALGDTLLPSPDLGAPGSVGVNSVDRPELCPGSGDVDAVGALRDVVADLRRQRDELAKIADRAAEILEWFATLNWAGKGLPRRDECGALAGNLRVALARTGAKAPEKE